MRKSTETKVPSASRKTAWQAVKFTLFSASAGIIQIASFALLDGMFHLPY